jgi:hypothetical protein
MMNAHAIYGWQQPRRRSLERSTPCTRRALLNRV